MYRANFTITINKHWEDLYSSLTVRSVKNLYNKKKAIIGIHCVADGIHPADNFLNLIGRIDKYLNEHQEVKLAIKEQDLEFKGGLPFNAIYTVEQFILGLLYCVQHEQRLQLMIQNEEVFNEIKKELLSEKEIERQFCGSSGWQSRIISPFIDEVLVYINPLTSQIIKLVPRYENLKTLDSNKNKVTAYKCSSSPPKEDAVHYAISFKKDHRVNLSSIDFDYKIDTDGVYIPSWNPLNNRLELNKNYQDFLIGKKKAKEYTHFMFSGFHILSPEYEKGVSVFDRIEELERFLGDIKNVNKDLKIHLEFGSIKNPIVRYATYGLLRKTSIDSLGLNEIELSQLLEDLGYGQLASDYRKGGNKIGFKPDAALFGIYKLLSNLKTKRIHLHHKDYQIIATTEQLNENKLMQYRDALLFASILCARRIGSAKNIDSFEEAFKAKSAPVSIDGIEFLLSIAENYHWKSEKEKGQFLKQGVFKYHPKDDPKVSETVSSKLNKPIEIIYVPTKRIERVINIAGSGETCVAAFHLST